MREPSAPVGLGDGERLKAELVGHLVPHGRVESVRGLHEATDLGAWRLLLEESANGATELLLLLAEREIHQIPSSVAATCRPSGRISSARDASRAAACVYQTRHCQIIPVSLGQAGPRPETQPESIEEAQMPPTIEYEDALVEVHKVVVGPMDNNVYVVRCRQTGDAVLIDAANEHEQLLELCRTLGVRQVLETHGHWDHIQAVPAVRDAGYSVGVTAADAAMLPAYDMVIEDDAVIEVGDLRVRTVATPGHTPGSICFAVEGTPLLLSGDTLFPGGAGATKFEGGDFATIIKSIDERLFRKFDASTIVLPGHGDRTTIGSESPHLQEWVDRGW